MFPLQRLATLSEESNEYGADVGGSRGSFGRSFRLGYVDIFLYSRFLYEAKLNYCDVTSIKNVLTWRVNA